MVKPAGYDTDPVEEVERFCSEHGIHTTRVSRSYGTLVRFDSCIYNHDHTDAGALVLSNGGIAYTCPHASCQEHKSWFEACRTIDPYYHAPRPVRIGKPATGSKYRTPAAEPDPPRDYSCIVARAASAIDFAKTQEPKQIVKGFLTDGVYFIDAPSKTGKSRLVLQMLLAISQGVEFMNRATIPGGCLYLALEDLHEDTEPRLRDFLAGAEPPDNLFILTKEDFPDFQTPRLGANGGLTDLIDCHMKQHPDTICVAIDVFSAIRSDSDFRDFTLHERADIDELLRLAAKYRFAVVVAHHVSKTGQAATKQSDTSIGAGAGSYSISGSVIGEISLIKDPDDKRFAVLRAEGRRTAASAIYVEDVYPRWRYVRENGERLHEKIETEAREKNAALIETAVYLVTRNGDQSKGWKGTAKEFRQENEMNPALPQITCAVDRNSFEPIANLLKARGVSYRLETHGTAPVKHWFTRCSTSVDTEVQDELPL